MKLTTVVLALTTLVVPVAPTSAANFKGCYERVYDKRYLKQHSKQDIIKIRLQLGVGKGVDGPFELLDRIDAGFRKRPIYQGNLVECKSVSNELICAVEAGGGSFTVTDRGKHSLRITNGGNINFGGDDGSFNMKAKGEHKEFRLFRIGESSCP